MIHATSFSGGLHPQEGDIKFYLDIVEPRIKSGGKPGQMEVDKITREVQIEVRMSAGGWIANGRLDGRTRKET